MPVAGGGRSGAAAAGAVAGGTRRNPLLDGLGGLPIIKLRTA